MQVGQDTLRPLVNTTETIVSVTVISVRDGTNVTELLRG